MGTNSLHNSQYKAKPQLDICPNWAGKTTNYLIEGVKQNEKKKTETNLITNYLENYKSLNRFLTIQIE